MKNVIFTHLILFFFVGHLYAQVEKTFVQSFAANDKTMILLDLDGDVDLEEWDEDIVRLHTQVTLDNGTQETLKYLMSTGRYGMGRNAENDTLRIKSTPRPQNIKYKNRLLEEKVRYKAFVPRNMEVEVIKIEILPFVLPGD